MATFETALRVGEYLLSAGQWLVMRVFKKKKLADRIIIESVPRTSALSIDCMGNTAQAYIRVYNFNPFDLKVQHFSIRLNHAGFSIKMMPDRLPTIPAFGFQDVYVRENLNAEHARNAALCYPDANNPNFEYSITFETRVSAVEKHGAIQNIPYEKSNSHVHALKAVG
jgi:hypothetical protein